MGRREGQTGGGAEGQKGGAEGQKGKGQRGRRERQTGGGARGRREGGRGAEGRGSRAERRRSARLGSLALERCLAAPLKGLGERLAEPLAMLAGVAEHLCP